MQSLDPLSIPAGEVGTVPISTKRVPNLFPSINSPSYRLAIIGEAPGEDEHNAGIPFIGMSGKFLDRHLGSRNISRSCCFIGNICQIRPPKNDISKFDFKGPEIQEGIAQLKKDLAEYKPNLCLLLGRTALFAFKQTYNISDWRGSIFWSEEFNVKCLSSYHPAACLRNYEWTPLFSFDLNKARYESSFPDLRLPLRNLTSLHSLSDLLARLDTIYQSKAPVSCDIEGGVSSVSCLSFATSDKDSFIVPFTHLDGSSYWSVSEEVEIWKRVSLILADPEIPKVWQNCLYDRFVLQWAHKLVVRNSKDDTMLKFWESYCELEKSLGFQCSILTAEPFYKNERKSQDEQQFYTYCCKDSAVTYEINEKLKLDEGQQSHYKFNNECLNALLYMELKGIRYNEDLAKQRLKEMEGHISSYQDQLDEKAFELGALERLDFTLPNYDLLEVVNKICCYKKDPTKPKASFLEDGYEKITEPLRSDKPLTSQQKGALSILCGTTMNTKSSKKFQDFLYKTCKLPTQYKKDPKTKELRPTTDYEALLKLSKSNPHPVLHLALELSRLRTRAQMLSMRTYSGRVYTSYNLVGSETGRVTSSKSMLYSGSKRVGANLQTIPDGYDVMGPDHPLFTGMRDLFQADPGYHLFQCDLKGSDGWTIGAYMAYLGDSTMLDDLRAGIKPANKVAHILMNGLFSLKGLTRPEIKQLLKAIDKNSWQYFVSKIGIWGIAYLMGFIKLGEQVFIQSEGKTSLTTSEAKDFKAAVLSCYDFTKWHKWMQEFLQNQGYPAKLTAPNGMTRKFFGRNGKQKCEILGEALAHMPQVITTWSTNMAVTKCWKDPENRIYLPNGGCDLRVQPLHQVHDALIGQFKIEDTEWALAKLKEWFNNPITIMNQTITIPFSGGYGPSWGELTTEF